MHDSGDVIAHRLDSWHGVHHHRRAFARVKVLSAEVDRRALRVAYRVLGPVCVGVDATFHCPDPRTVVMTIAEGKGARSVVETHATPVGDGWTAVVEATIASSERLGFQAAQRLAAVTRPLLRRAANRLWSQDAACAERLFSLRGGARVPPRANRGWRAAPASVRWSPLA